MELYQLQTFVIVAEEESLTRAAKRLYTTPSTISLHIKALEDELNVQLFIRTSRGMQITEKGRLLEQKARQTLLAAQDFVNHAIEMQAHLMGEVVIGLCASPLFLRIPALIESLKAACPGIDLEFKKSTSQQIAQLVLAEEVTLGYVFGAVDTAQFHQHLLTQAQLVIAAPPTWQVQGAGWEELAQLPWIDTGINCPFQVLITTMFQNQQLEYKRAVQSDDEATRLDLVSAGVGLSLLEKSEAEEAARHGRLMVLADHAPISCPLSLIYRAQDHYNPVISTLAQQITQAWGM